MSNNQIDLTEIYYREVNNLMFIVGKIIEADKQNQDFSLLIKELPTYFQAVKQAQKQKEDFNKKLKEIQGL